METKNKKKAYILTISAIIIFALLLIPNVIVYSINQISDAPGNKLGETTELSKIYILDNEKWR